MRCPKCKSQSRVIDTSKKTDTYVRRRRRCKACLHRWSTYEICSANIPGGIAIERLRQDRKWGEQNHSPTTWLLIILEELGEAAQAVLQGDPSRYYEELTQTAASSEAAMESFNRQRKTGGKQHDRQES